ncbi:MAG: hypothetical protein GC137_09660 [Alphaproteobacteria bacterium]|nr:hypothetical protein [Alphaproteobacteria bacterium]
MAQKNNQNILEQAIKDPAAIYEKPYDVVCDNRTTLEEKKKILQSWELDQKRLMTAEAENMGKSKHAPEPSELLQKIIEAKKSV